MRLIADGVVDRDGVAGLAAPPRLQRAPPAPPAGRPSSGAGPLALARAQRAQTARLLIETTDLPFAEVAFAAGFASIRQFNDTIREVFARTPTELRRPPPASAAVTARPARSPCASPCASPSTAPGLLAFLGLRAIPGIEELVDGDATGARCGCPTAPASSS